MQLVTTTTPFNQAAISTNVDCNAVEFYVAGCNAPHCFGCHNPELWDFKAGSETIDYKRLEFLSKFYPKLFLMGGEPLDHNIFGLREFTVRVKRWFSEVWLFTRYSLEDIPSFCLTEFDFIKTGQFNHKISPTYIPKLGIILSSRNQKVLQKGVDY